MSHWKALAQAVIDRRVGLGHNSREAFAQASGISLRTLGDIESARRQSYAPETLVRLEKALEWETGTVQGILDRPRLADRRFPEPDLEIREPLPGEVVEFMLTLRQLNPALRHQALQMVGNLTILLLTADQGSPPSDEKVPERAREGGQGLAPILHPKSSRQEPSSARKR